MREPVITTDSFTEFVNEVEPRLKRALVAAFGTDVGVEATAEALAHGWEHWSRVSTMDNPAGYLWGVGRNKARRRRRQRVVLPEIGPDHEPWIEPGLPAAMAQLSESQRTAVLLLHGHQWTHREVADLLGVTIPTVQKHADRGMAKLRRQLRSAS